MADMQPAQQSLMAVETVPLDTLGESGLDTLAETLQEEGAQEFQHEFFEQVD
jgi:hypothetical protein